MFDSGVGGLTVLRSLYTSLPRESTIYLGDNARVPYGELPGETIRRYTLECLDYLYHRGVKALVIACNTATSEALESAQSRYDVPVIGVIECTAREVASTAGERVGVLATEATVRSGQYGAAIRSARPELQVLEQPCPGLAARVEACALNSPQTRSMLENFLQPLQDAGVDTVVLGCTHYAFLRDIVKQLMGPGVEMAECGPSTVSVLESLMERGVLDRAEGGVASHRLLTTGRALPFQRIARLLFAGDLPRVEEVKIEVAGE
ncbi:MAG TPA: glutamate racemase [Chloroflexota bacterium]|nr:glutamate racemase [Chloroflexota bacterium]